MVTFLRRLLPFFLLLGAILGFYQPSFSGEFVFDDRGNILQNPRLRTLWPPWGPMAHSSRPLTQLTFALNYALGQGNVFGYHLVNLLIHLLATLVLFGILRRTFTTRPLLSRYGAIRTPLATAIALVWAIHPIQTASVTYIVQRAESLMGLFYLLTLYCSLRSFGAPSHRLWPKLAIAACFLGMLSKPIMVTAPLLILLYDRAFFLTPFKQLLSKRKGLYGGLAATWGILLIILLLPHESVHSVGEEAGFSPLQYAATQPGVLLHYLKLVFWPHPLLLDPQWPPLQDFRQFLLPGIPVGLLLLATLLSLRPYPQLSYLGAWFFLILAPTSSFFPLNDPAYEHRMYLPLLAPITLTLLGGWEILRRGISSPALQKSLACTLLIAAALPLGWRTRERNKEYKDGTTLWKQIVDQRPSNARGLHNLGETLYRKGRVEEAITLYRKAIEIEPIYPTALYNLGLALAKQGRAKEAIPSYRRSLEIEPNSPECHYQLGLALAGQGSNGEATACFQEAVKLRPLYPEAHYQLGIALEKQGRFQEAAAHLQQAQEYRRNEETRHVNQGAALLNQGRFGEAVQQFQQALEVNPQSLVAHYNLGLALLNQGNPEEAIGHFSYALAIDPGDVETRIELGVALLQQGRDHESAEEFFEVLRQNPNNPRAHHNLAVVLRKMGRTEEAAKHRDAETHPKKRLGAP